MDSCFHAVAENGAMAGRERTDPICYVLKKTAPFLSVSAVVLHEAFISFMR